MASKITRTDEQEPIRHQEKPEGASPASVPRAGQIAGQARGQLHDTTTQRAAAELTDEQQHILREAMSYCVRQFPTLWTTGGLPEECEGGHGSRQWIIRVYLRYPTGFEGYLGDLRYDGKQFTELTDRKVMHERAKQIEADPALQRQWNEYRASTLPPRKT
jgi:hypothetical protein